MRDHDALTTQQHAGLDHGEILFHPRSDLVLVRHEGLPALPVTVGTPRAHQLTRLADQLVGQLPLAAGPVEAESDRRR